MTTEQEEEQAESEDSTFIWLDKYILRDAVAQLPPKQQEILKKRFTDNLQVHEIASLLNLKCKEVERYLAMSLRKLRDFCLKDPAFSRNWLATAET